MCTLMMAFRIFLNAERPMCAADVQVRLPAPYSNPRLLVRALRVQGCIAETFRVRNEKFYALVPDAAPPTMPDAARTSAATEAALKVRQKQRFAMLAREARRRG